MSNKMTKGQRQLFKDMGFLPTRVRRVEDVLVRGPVELVMGYAPSPRYRQHTVLDSHAHIDAQGNWLKLQRSPEWHAQHRAAAAQQAQLKTPKGKFNHE